MASITGAQIIAALNEWGVVQFLGDTTAESGLSSYLTDTTRLQSTDIAASRFNNCYVRLLSGTLAGQQSRVDYIDVTNGRLYVSPSFSVVVPNDTDYAIYYPGVDPDILDRCRDRALQYTCSQWAMQPLSEIDNSDFEDALAASNWTAQGGPTPFAIQALTFPYESFRNSLLFTNTIANGYARSASLYVQPGQKCYLYIPVSVRVGTAEVVVRNVTAGSNITTSGTATATGRGWSGIELTASIPSGCYELQVWLRGQGATDQIEWGPLHFHWVESRRIALPARVQTSDHVGSIFYAVSTMPTSANTTYRGEEQITEDNSARKEQVMDSVIVRWRTSGMGETPYWFHERVFYDALQTAYFTTANRSAGLSATTLCALNYVVAGTCRQLAEEYRCIYSEDTFWSNLLIRAEKYLIRAEREFGPKPDATTERSNDLVVPMVEV